MRNESKRVALSLPASIAEKLEGLATEQGLTKSAVVINLVNDADREAKKEKASAR